jgi:hypothetical protein
VVAGNGVDRTRDPFERQKEFGLVVDHGAGRIHDVGGHNDEADVRAVRDREELIPQHVLRGVSLAGVADHHE